jgi:hypothetical protein
MTQSGTIDRLVLVGNCFRVCPDGLECNNKIFRGF